jgi:hypothetical protein
MCDLLKQLEGGGGKLRTETRASQTQEPSLRRVESSIAPPHAKESSLSHEQDRDGPIRVVLQRLAAQVCMNVIRQFVLLFVRLNNRISRIRPMY